MKTKAWLIKGENRIELKKNIFGSVIQFLSSDERNICKLTDILPQFFLKTNPSQSKSRICDLT